MMKIVLLKLFIVSSGLLDIRSINRWFLKFCSSFGFSMNEVISLLATSLSKILCSILLVSIKLFISAILFFILRKTKSLSDFLNSL